MSKIKIITVPEEDKNPKPKKTIQPLKGKDKHAANIEAERSEILLGPMSFDGIPELYNIGGKPHSQGGTPLNVPDNSFFFSKDKTLKLADENLQTSFGKKAKASGYTMAELAKQYDLNKFKAIFQDKNSDALQKKTAKTMMQNMNHKLGKLSLVQESMKGFPDGIPMVAVPYLTDMGIDVSSIVDGVNPEQPAVPSVSEMKRGGAVKMKIKIAALPKAQKGKEKKSSNAASAKFYLRPGFETGDEFFDPTKYTYPTAYGADKGQVPVKQGQIRGKTNVFGYENLDSPQVLEDFKQRFAKDYLKQNPDFDPHNPADVKDFQTWHRNESIKRGYTPYFVPQGKNKTVNDIDSQWGAHTAYAMGFRDPMEVQLDEVEVTPQNQTSPAAAPVIQIPQRGAPATAPSDTPFWTQDIVNLAGAASDYSHINKYLPWQAGFETFTNTPTYYDPTRELASNNEQSNATMSVLGAFADPQSLSSRASQVSGQALSNAADIMGRYNNLNVGVANQTQAQNSAILNEASRTRAAQATNLYDNTVRANQTFDNSRAMARRNIRDAFNQAWTNRGQTQGLNSINKQYNVDSRTGYVHFTGVPGEMGTVPDVNENAQDYYNELMKNPNLQKNPEHAAMLMKAYLANMGVKL